MIEAMDDFVSRVQKEQKNLTEEEQKKIGTPISGSMDSKYKDFLQTIMDLLEKKEIDPMNPESLLNRKVYDNLSEEQRAAIDLTIVTDHLRHIAEFELSKETPEVSPQLETMVKQLQQTKERIEGKYGDVFKF